MQLFHLLQGWSLPGDTIWDVNDDDDDHDHEDDDEDEQEGFMKGDDKVEVKAQIQGVFFTGPPLKS